MPRKLYKQKELIKEEDGEINAGGQDQQPPVLQGRAVTRRVVYYLLALQRRQKTGHPKRGIEDGRLECDRRGATQGAERL